MKDYSVLNINEDKLLFSSRDHSGEASVNMAWSVGSNDGGRLHSGIVYWDGYKNAPFKTLDYEEILYVIEGEFGFEVENGDSFFSCSGGTLRIPFGTRVRYFGKNAKVFFAVTPQLHQ